MPMTTSPPRPDYDQHLARLFARVQDALASGTSPTSRFAGAPAAVAAGVAAAAEAVRPDLIALSHDIHGHPELGFEEHHAAAAVVEVLRRHGHDATVPAFGLDTAVLATAGGGGGPHVAFLAEYDALPQIGHACGHNVICASAVGGFLATADVARALGGRVSLIGTPAEEGGGGKELIALAGGFDDVDAAVMLHPFFADVADHPFIGIRTVEAVYSGITAHASALPFLGRNALDAAVQAYQGMAQLRQHMLPSDRVHGIITDGGQRPNIVPDRAALEFYVRSAHPDTLAELSRRTDAVLRGAADQAGVAVSVNWDTNPPYLPTRLNGPLTDRYAVNLASRGRAVLPGGVIPTELTGSTDLGNVSVRVPSIHPLLDIAPFGVSPHNPAFAEHAASPEADTGVLDGAVALALTAADFLADASLRDAVRADFDAAGGVLDPREAIG